MKPLILNVNLLTEECFVDIMKAFSFQYGEDVLGQHCFFALSNDDGAMFQEHYDDNEAWERTKSVYPTVSELLTNPGRYYCPEERKQIVDGLKAQKS